MEQHPKDTMAKPEREDQGKEFVGRGYRGVSERTDTPCPVCEKLGIKTLGGYTPRLFRWQSGEVECELGHRADGQ